VLGRRATSAGLPVSTGTFLAKGPRFVDKMHANFCKARLLIQMWSGIAAIIDGRRRPPGMGIAVCLLQQLFKPRHELRPTNLE